MLDLFKTTYLAVKNIFVKNPDHQLLMMKHDDELTKFVIDSPYEFIEETYREVNPLDIKIILFNLIEDQKNNFGGKNN